MRLNLKAISFSVLAIVGTANVSSAAVNSPRPNISAARQANTIKSQVDLANLMRSGQKTPLSFLSEQGRQRFVSSLTFTRFGLSSYSYSALRSELTASQIYSVLAMFGLEGETHLIQGVRVTSQADFAVMHPDGMPVNPGPGGPIKDYYCPHPGTCAPYTGDYCTENC